ncbi:hypothetical protein RCO22_08540 [Pseudomonas yamanorum]|jgi:hypothetical protein|uniref:IrrE N-terminal-like domain-containing protein n=1 Tax=Pseudomonas yamanorum TaxID=515393 RepID=A0ABU1CNX9_9PSED|nr:hypothetical protein [Pseudomonas yamanorum]MDR0188982.1 hypothetical protein [Pseudomonas yamanorum]
MDVDQILRSAGLDPRLIPEDLADNPWFELCVKDLSALCELSLDEPLNFTFNVSPTVQARILYNSRLVVMYGGMFNAFCRLAAKIVSSGAFIEFEGGVEPDWLPEECLTADPVLPHLSTGMHWKLESVGWKDKPERQVLFMYLVLTLSRFVTLHEVGHVYHGHDRRFANSGDELCDVDAANPTVLPLEESIPSQAREILADDFAFKRLRQCMTRELQSKADTPAAKLLRAKLLGDESKITRFLLHVTHLYFHMMDRHDWMLVDYKKMTHPPAPFRQQSLYVLAQELGFEGMSAEETENYLAATHHASELLVAVVHQQLPPFAVYGIHEQEKFHELYEMIYGELPNWSRK